MHSCGHDAIPAGVVATALAFADLREELPGSLVVFGCPADEIPAPLTVEIGGGKAVSAAAGLWDAVDAALYAHPEFEDTVFLRSRWMRRDRAMVTGTRSLTHEPESPIEAVLTAIAAVKSLPPADAIVEHIALDGDVEEGGGLVVRIHFLLRADEEAGLDELAAPLRAALPEAVWSSDPVVCGLRPDDEVTQAVKEAVLALGGEFVDDPAQLPFGTDFGNVSQRVPSALDRHRPPWRLGVPHRRRRRAVRAGRRGVRPVDRAGPGSRGRATPGTAVGATQPAVAPGSVRA